MKFLIVYYFLELVMVFVEFELVYSGCSFLFFVMDVLSGCMFLFFIMSLMINCGMRLL